MVSCVVNKRSTIGLSSSRGFTLLELLAVCVIFALLITLAVPGGRELVVENRGIAQINTLVGALYFARSAAIQRGSKTIFCKSADQQTCSGNWVQGQIITDALGNLLRAYPALSNDSDLVWNSSGGKDDSVEWLPTGYTNGQRGTFYYCVANEDVSHSRAIVLLNTGRVYVTPITKEDYHTYCFS